MKTVIKNVQLINEGKIIETDVLINGERIEKIANSIESKEAQEINGEGQYLMPGVIDDQVHFREPGLTHKANIFTESRAAVAGGTTSFMEMPNTKPPTITQTKLVEKYQIAAKNALANYSFFMGAANDNYDEVMKTDINKVCGIKIFMGSSTGNMLVDNENTLEKIFANAPCLIATHCEDEDRIKSRKAEFEAVANNATYHPIIRDAESCYISSSKAIDLAKKHNTRLHILHISTKDEIALFNNSIPLKDKRITAEVCVHHLSLDDSFYPTLGTKIQCNPAIKSKQDQDALWQAMLDNHLDIIATDHAPHTQEEKALEYGKAPSGLPLVQHALQLMLNHVEAGKLSFEKVVEKMCHAPAICFKLKDRGFVREGYFADLVLFKKEDYTVKSSNILYKCGWSPFEGKVFDYSILKTIVNGHIAFTKEHGINELHMAKRLNFDRI